MPYYTESPIGTDAPLQDLAPSLGSSVGAAVDDTFIGNPSKVIYDYTQVQRANAGERLDKATADEKVRQAGVSLKIPDTGYSSQALDMLIERKRDEIARKSILDRAPSGVLPTTARFAASLMTGVLDPINVASAFVPIVGEARVAAMLAQAGSVAGRVGVRAAIGAAEGAVGAALVEPISYFGRTQMQDDYSMSDSLANLAFGTIAGGALHAGGGAAGDALGVSKFIRDERARAADASAARVQAAAPLAPAEQPAARPWFSTPDITAAPEAPFAKRWEATPETARAAAVQDLAPDLRAQLLADAGQRAEPGVIPQARAQIDELSARLDQLDSQDEFKRRAKEFQGQGNSRGQAETLARKAVAADKADAQATQQRLQETVDANTRAAQAEQDIAKLDAGEVPGRFTSIVDERAAQVLQASELERALNSNSTPAAFTIGMADPVQRDAAMRTAVAQVMDGRMPDVETLFRRSENPIGDARVTATRQAAPESLAIADFPAARAADERIAAAAPAESAAQDSLDMASARMDELLKNLEQRGYNPERIAKLREELAPFDEALADSKKLGAAMKAAATCGIR